MDRAEATGFGVSVVGHCALLAAAWLVVSRPTPPQVSQAFEVSYVDEVGLTAASPQPAPSAQASVAPEVASPEEAAPAPAPAPVPEPTPAPPRAAPRPAPSPERAAAPPKPSPPQVARQQGSAATQRNTGSRLGAELLRGLGNDRNVRTNSPPAQMTGQAAANIAQAIQRQIQPCADRQINPGPGAERITTAISLSLNPDGSLAARPRAGAQTGVDDENRRYAARVADLAIASFVGCAPLRGLPAELYAVPRGWRNLTMRYRLPG
jgi:outer membrane biosynthesis protein TonB